VLKLRQEQKLKHRRKPREPKQQPKPKQLNKRNLANNLAKLSHQILVLMMPRNHPSTGRVWRTLKDGAHLKVRRNMKKDSQEKKMRMMRMRMRIIIPIVYLLKMMGRKMHLKAYKRAEQARKMN
jgi:hypothetical protein